LEAQVAATVWKGYITFGLISIPVRLYSGARDEHVEFHQLHDKCHTRVKQQLYCPHCKRAVERDEIVKGHEVSKGKFVIIEEEDIQKAAPASSDSMEILDVVKLSEIDPIYYESSYYAVPEAAGGKAYSLLLDAMQHADLAAVAKLAMHRREYTVVIRPQEKGLILHTMYYPNEVRSVPEYDKIHVEKISAKERQMAEKLLTSLETKWDPEKYHDTYQERLEKMVAAKAKGKTIKAVAEKKPAPVIDLMQALEQSLKGATTKKSKRAA
jgi:DNA end-binding protein Ku